MSYCRSASELESIKELKLNREASKLIEGMPPEEVILRVRNSSLLRYFVDELDKNDYSDDEWDKEYSRLNELCSEIRRAVVVAGFARNELFDLVNPESYFVHEYVRGLGLLSGDYERCMPFYSSNEVYETYVFSYERLQKILEILKSELTSKQFSVIKGDIMYLDGYFRTDSALIEAKLQLIMNKHELDKKLSQIWM